MKGLEVHLYKRRKLLISPLRGNVLEIGSGTGVNFKFYNESTNIYALEPSLPMLEKAKQRIRDSKAEIRLLNFEIEDNELLDYIPVDGFDAIVCTLVLCTVPNLEDTIGTIKRMLAVNGELIILEHIHAKKEPKAFFQTLVNPLWKKVGEGCNLNRKTDEFLKEKGFKSVKSAYFKHSIDFYEGVFKL